MACSSTQPSATAKSILTPVMALEGHEPYGIPSSDGSHYEYKDVSCISYFPDGKQIISGSADKTIRRWDLQEGKEIEEAREVCEYHVQAMGVSKDGRWVVTAGGGEFKVCEVETGIVRTIHHEAHFISVNCIDISPDSTLLVSGSWDGAARIWSLETGKLVAGPFDLKAGGDYVGAFVLGLSENSKKLAVMLRWGQCLQVWDIQTQKLEVTRGKYGGNLAAPRSPVFWTTKDKSIVTAFCFTPDDWQLTSIYEFDASTLKTVGAPFEGHTDGICGLALSSDCVLLASASFDHTINLWAFESRQLLASFDAQASKSLILSPDSRQLAYTAFDDTKIYICNIPSNILASIGLAEEPQPSTSKSERLLLAGLLNSDATRRNVRHIPVILPVISPVTRPSRPLPTRDPHAFFHFLRKHLPSRTDAVRPDEPRNLLDFPATSPLPGPHTSITPNKNSRPTQATPAIQSSAINASTIFKSRLHQLSTWSPMQTDHASPTIVDVPLAQGKQRHAAAGAPGDDDEWIRDEEYVSPPPSPNPGSRQPTTSKVVNAGERGSGRFCFCL